MPGYFCRVFQVFKNETQDRQIGDRRLPNASEYHVAGPSKNLPPGHLLVQLWLKRGSQRLLGSVTDRRDFYHQAEVSLERARTNMLPISYDLEDFRGTKAFDEYLARSEKKGNFDRHELGDRFGSSKLPRPSAASSSKVYPAFRGLFQGDHLGVEFALAGHEGLLDSHGLLRESDRLKGHCLVPFGPRWTGLIIDDFFAIQTEDLKTKKADSFAFQALARAREVYAADRLLGSDEKDVEAQTVFKAAGAEIRSDEASVRRGNVSVASPLAKRIALSALTLRTTSLPALTITLASRLAGNWVSVLLYRRCLSSCVDSFFSLATQGDGQVGDSLVRLDRRAAEELVLLSIFAPFASANVASKVCRKIYASDSSSSKGAFMSVEVNEDTAKALWQAGDKKGSYTKLQNPFASVLADLGEETCETEGGLHGLDSKLGSPFKAPLLKFDFVKIFGGAGVVSKAAAELGLVVAPCLDLSESSHYDLRGSRLLEWCIYMIEESLFESFLLEPPCTSFSPAAHPAVRSYDVPLGFDRRNPKTLHGNILAFRSFVLLKVGRRKKRPCGLEQPRLSKMAWTSFWSSLLDLGFEESIIASCQFGASTEKSSASCYTCLMRKDLRLVALVDTNM